MHDPYFDHRLDPNALSRLGPIAGLIFAAALMGIVALDALGAARIIL
jgi:hypothetical protein